MLNDQIDQALDLVLRASGSALKNYTMPASLKRMREAMRSAMRAPLNDRETLLEMLKRANIPHRLEDEGGITIDFPPGRQYVAFDFNDDGALTRVGVWED